MLDWPRSVEKEDGGRGEAMLVVVARQPFKVDYWLDCLTSNKTQGTVRKWR